jgi:hypothetical protein
LLSRLHAFGGDGEAHRVAQRQYRRYDCGGIDGVTQMLDETAIDLDLVHLEPAQIAQAGIAGAEIVARNAEAGRTQPLQRIDHRLAVVQQQSFRYFEFDPVRINTAIAHDRGQSFGNAARAELHRRKVDCNEQVRPPPRGRASLTQHPFTELRNEAGLFCYGDELVRCDQPKPGVLPSNEGFETDDFIC